MLALTSRMLVCPMRSKFTTDKVAQTMEPYTYDLDSLIHKKFKDWRSALLDYLILYCHENGLSGLNIPDSMKEWKDDIVTGNNEVGGWLDEHTEAGGPSDFVSLVDLKDLYCNQQIRGKPLSSKDFMAAAKALFVGRGLAFKERHRFTIGGVRKEKKSVVLCRKSKFV